MINRILIVGYGSIGKRHLLLARKYLPSACIAVLHYKMDISIPEQADRVFSTLEEALVFAPNIAVIANPATFHISMALPLAKLGVHLLIEKPLSHNSTDIAKLSSLCSKKKLVCFTGYNLRFLPSLKKLKEIVEDEVVGKPWSIRIETGQYLPEWRPDSDYKKSVTSQSRLGGGALLELSHEIDYLTWIFGDVDWIQASLNKLSDLDIDVEDSVFLLMKMKSHLNKEGIVASVNLDLIRSDKSRTCTLIAEHGSIRWDCITGCIDLYKRGGSSWTRLYEGSETINESYDSEWRQFLLCVESESDSENTIESGLKVIKIVEAARKSAKLNKRVQLKV